LTALILANQTVAPAIATSAPLHDA